MARIGLMVVLPLLCSSVAACGGRSVNTGENCDPSCDPSQQCVQGLCVAANQPGPDAGPVPPPPPPIRVDASVPDFRPVDFKAPKDLNPVPPVDIAIVPPSCPAANGTPCSAQAQCGAGAKCIGLGSNSIGVCACSCTPDNFETPLINEDSCPSNAICGPENDSAGFGQNYCFETCQPTLGSNPCKAPLACLAESAGYAAYSFASTAVCALPGCSSDAECPVTTDAACNALTGDGCAVGETCHAVEGTTSGRCAKPGSCDVASGQCLPHGLGNPAGAVGDPCQSDLDCGQAMRCQLESNVAGAVVARNGYCMISGCVFSSTLPHKACPSGAACSRLFSGGLCQKSCTVGDAQSCRGNASDVYGDYECRDWTTLAIGGNVVSPTPVCGFATTLPCSLLEGSGITCAVVGSSSANDTKMACRGLDGVVKTDPYDPSGYCLDETGSGPMPLP